MFSTSVNIARDKNKKLNYIVTANAKQVVGKMVNSFASGIHSFCLIGSYGTGKSSFILALENTLMGVSKAKNALFKYNGQFNNATEFEFVNIVGEYDSFVNTIKPHILLPNAKNPNFFVLLEQYYEYVNKQGRFLVFVIDEFGKMLEYAAKNNPEREMYFVQKFVEFINDTSRNMMLITTLHQGFGSYAKSLTDEQKQEWKKVKGRLTDIVFKEPVEQLMALTASRISEKHARAIPSDTFNHLYGLAKSSKFISSQLKADVAQSLYPLDVFSAAVITQANQRYGQNERTLFTFLDTQGEGTLNSFVPQENLCYNLAYVYDYITYNFYDYLSDINEDSAQWASIRTAIERVEGLPTDNPTIENAIAIVKVVGLLNIFAPATTAIDADFLSIYTCSAMGIANGIDIVRRLEKEKILRFARYKKKYILFEGTDVDIEAGMLAAAAECKRQSDYTEQLQAAFHFKAVIANAHYFKTGTPRYFEYTISSEPKAQVPAGETDGYINLVFPPKNDYQHAEEICLSKSGVAIIYCVFKNTSMLEDYLFEIEKLTWVKEKFIADDNDKVAHREVDNLITHARQQMQEAMLSNIFSPNTAWFFDGEKLTDILCDRDLSKRLSDVSDKIYNGTPIFRNELINKHKPSGTISTARQTFLIHLLEESEKEDLGFDKDKFPPEKAIYKTLLQSTGMHKADGALYVLGEPQNNNFGPIWETSEGFLQSTNQRPRRLSEFVKILKEAPFRLKQGFIDLWIPTFLIIKKDDYALYSEDRYVPYLNKDVLELMMRSPNEYSVKAFSVEGVKRQFFDKYREAINLSHSDLKTDSFIETIRPFLTFYKRLNKYAQNTNSVSPVAQKFRNIIREAVDPEKTFFETLPEALGFNEQNPDAIDSFVEALQNAIRELRCCYDEYLKQVEESILKMLGIEAMSFAEYKPVIETRYKNVKTDLMPIALRNFHSRLVSKFADMKTWLESVCYVVLNKPLDSIKDAEKGFLVTSLQDRFFQLDDYVVMHQTDNESVVRLHITQNNIGTQTKQVVIPKGKEKELAKLENKIEKLLSADESLNLAALIQLLNKKMQ